MLDVQMRLMESGVICAGTPGGERQVATFPSLTALRSGRVLAVYRIGASKDSAGSVTEIRVSGDEGRTWSEAWAPFSARYAGVEGSLQVVYLTELRDGRVLASALWVDREAYPGQPLFNAETEGCLPMKVLVAESRDEGQSFSAWREVPVTEDVGPPSLTNPVLVLPSGRLAVIIETNKPYLDRSEWRQRVVYCYSADGGQTWGAPRTVCEDGRGEIFHWDQRAAVAPNGVLAAFSWTYDKRANRYLPIRRHVSRDEGETWRTDELGFADQPSHPAIFPDGRTVLAWVDRYGSRTIKARMAQGVEEEFEAATEVTLYRAPAAARATATTGEMLADMSLWSFGLPYAVALPSGEALVSYYAGTAEVMDVRVARLGW
jgi:hypothetical protein